MCRSQCVREREREKESSITYCNSPSLYGVRGWPLPLNVVSRDSDVISGGGGEGGEGEGGGVGTQSVLEEGGLWGWRQQDTA